MPIKNIAKNENDTPDLQILNAAMVKMYSDVKIPRTGTNLYNPAFATTPTALYAANILKNIAVNCEKTERLVKAV